MSVWYYMEWSLKWQTACMYTETAQPKDESNYPLLQMDASWAVYLLCMSGYSAGVCKLV